MSGGPAKISPGVPPSAARHARGGGGGRAGGLGGRSLGQGFPLEILQGVLPPDDECPGGTENICQGSPPLLQGVQEGGLVGLVARVGAHRGGAGQDISQGSSPWMVSVRGDLGNFYHGLPPLLRVVGEGGGGCLACLVAQVGTCLYLVARSPPRGRGVRRNFCKWFSPG